VQLLDLAESFAETGRLTQTESVPGKEANSIGAKKGSSKKRDA